jgi:catechol 2,3-dioxygenase-like lactoylglutathione lyase family enzyme
MPIGASHVFHLNVNCSDLDRSLTFYRDAIGLTAGAHTVPPAQPGAAFGLDVAQWDAWILNDDRGIGAGVAVDLLQWLRPTPVGTPPLPNQLGFARLGFTTADLDATHARVASAVARLGGAGRVTEPHGVTMDGAPTMRTFVGADPDGTAFEFVSGNAERFSFVAINCSDLDRSAAFYSDVLGFHERIRFAPGPRDETGLGLGTDAEWEMAYLDDPRGDGTFAIDLVEWKRPLPTGRPSNEANRLGPFRLALMTDDIDRDDAELRSLGVEPITPPAELDMGPGLPRLRALLFPDPDGTILELIETPTL